MTTTSTSGSASSPRLRCGTVLRVHEDACELISADRLVSARYVANFPAPRTERVSPGHLVAVATGPNGSEVVVWRWYDAVVLGESGGLVRLWEPAHGEVEARRRITQLRYPPGTRAYLSAGLPGAEWWVAGGAVARAESAEVELDEVERLYADNDLWSAAFEL